MSESASGPSRTPSTDLSGRQLGDFRLLRRLGRGAMAEVYLAEQGKLQRRVALKILKPELAQDRVYLQRFEREAQAAASLVHANIVQIHEVGKDGPYHYIAQEYVEGQNLREWITRNGPADLPHALSIMRQAAAALAKAGEQGIVHRDIKPENIMLTRSGEVKVADFGLARFAREGDSLDLTQVGMTLGTPLYMSPEQVEGKSLDPRSDIYSLGVTCYHMLSGQPPFSGDTALAVAVQHINREPKSLDQGRPDLPPGLVRIVHKMLAKKPDDRYGSATLLLRDLRKLQSENLGEAWPEDLTDWNLPTAATSSNAEMTRQLDGLMKTVAMDRVASRTRRWLWVSVAVALLLGGGIGYLLREPNLVAVGATGGATVARQENVMRQWFFASQVGTEDAWRSIIEYFPKNQYMVHRAQQQLARIYLREGRYRQAMAIFEELAALGDGDDDFRAYGLAGKCGVLTLEKHYKESAATLEELWPLRDRLTDLQMRQFLDHALAKNRSALGPQSSQQWQQWLRDQFRQGD